MTMPKALIKCICCLEEKKHEARGLCGRCYRATWKLANPDKVRAYSKKYFAVHIDAEHVRKRKWRETHIEEDKQRHHDYYQLNKIELLTKHQQNRQAHPEREILYRTRYYETHIDQERERRGKYRSKNIDRIRERDREASRHYRSEHPEERRLAEQRREAQKRSVPATLTVAQWRAIKAAYKHRCAYCYKQLERLTMDHVIPLAKGGGTVAENIVPACRSCNSSKGAKLIQAVPMVRLMF